MKTDFEVMMEQQALNFRLSDTYKWAWRECAYCFNTGVVLKANGPDDFDWESCGCGLKPLEGSKEAYLLIAEVKKIEPQKHG